MTKIEEIAKIVAQAIEKANSAYVFLRECDYIVKILCELRDRISDFPSQANDEDLDPILSQLNNLCNIFDSFKDGSWEQASFQTPIEVLISNLNETMELLTRSLEKIGIKLTNEYTVSTDYISDDLNSIYGKLADPFKMEKQEVKDKLDEIEQYLNKIGKPLDSSSSVKEKIKSDSIDKHTDSLETTSSFDDDDELDERCDFNDVQKYKLQKTDYIQDPHPTTRNNRYSIYKGQMKLSKQDVTIMVLRKESFTEDKFKRFVNVLTAVKHPNLESFVGAVEFPLPYTIVTRRIGEKLSSILKREKLQGEKSQDKEKDEEEEEEEESDEIIIKPGYRTIIAYQIASAMAYLHSLKITHRDLCTNNVTLDQENNARIINFATSRFVPENSLAMSFKPSSSTEFKAPEISDMEGYSKEVDVFSYSGILYELLTDTAPFSNVKKTNIEALIRKSTRPTLPEKISSDLKNLIESCWDQDPQKRPSFADIVQMMLTKSISFPQDENSDILNQFYASKKIKNVDFQACFNLIKKIQEEITNSFAYKEEAARIRTLLHGYQHVLQTSEYAKKDKITDDNVNIQIYNLRASLDNLLATLQQTEKSIWLKLALRIPALEIPTDLHRFMEQIYISLKLLGFDVQKYKFVDKYLEWDLRFIYSYIKYSTDDSDIGEERMQEIQDFMNDKNLELTATPMEIHEVLSDWKDYEVDRSDFKLSSISLGHGVSCKVFKAMRISTKKQVAIKALNSEYIEEKDQFKLLRREIGILIQLNNEFLIDFVGFNDDPGLPLWIVTEYIKGGNLSTAIKKKKLNPFLKTKIAFEIAQGMEYLRSKGIIHRDLKTANIMLDGDPKNLKPKIGDFGYSRTETSLKMSSMRGTANYMAPEVINGDCYDFKADVFSYGMILWELYADEHPFANCTQEKVFELISSNTKLEFRKLISQDLKDLIEDATNFDPLKRPSFTEIINRMIDNNISFNGNNPAQIRQFYTQKAQERNSH